MAVDEVILDGRVGGVAQVDLDAEVVPQVIAGDVVARPVDAECLAVVFVDDVVDDGVAVMGQVHR